MLDGDLLASQLPETRGWMSVSGVQTKHQIKLIDRKLVFVDHDGDYLLKPIPNGRFKHLDQAPANEHLTMQIARQIFRIETASNGLVFLGDLSPAYITKRFDKLGTDRKLLMEDMAQITGRSEERFGENYKYESSYEEIAQIIRKNCSSYRLQIEKFYKLVVFNYLFSNGDAHLKNFSLIEEPRLKNSVLAPAYDLLNTGIHIPGESDTALELFGDGFLSESYSAGSKYNFEDFQIFATRCGIRKERFKSIYELFITNQMSVQELVNRSFLSEDAKTLYYESYLRRLDRLKKD